MTQLTSFVLYGVLLVSFLAGPGTCFGEEPESLRTIRITREPVCPGQIHPYQYGQFVEYLCDLVPSMWAEKLYDGSFEGLSPYKVAFLRQTDFREKPWYPSGQTNRAEYTRDSATRVSGEVSQKIQVKLGPPCTVGISQDGIAVESGKRCNFSCFLRQEGVSHPIRIRLHREGTTLAVAEVQPTQQWHKLHAPLIPRESDARATLTMEFQGPGTLWLDNASLMPDANDHGWRPDVVAAVRALRPGIIRFGGSTLDDPNLGEFEWRDTVGDPDHRRPFRAWGGLQPTGPGLEEIVQFCRMVGAEPLICVRVSRRQPKDAAEQVEYFNGSADTPMGKLRSQNGHPEPYRIRYWQIGNERAGQEYESRLADFCRAMKQVDPTIKLFSSYPREGVLRAAGKWLDYVCPHHYGCRDLAGMERDLVNVAELCRKIVPERQIKIAVTEWNTTGGDWGTGRATLWTLENALACSRYHNLLHRHCDTVEIANRSNLINSFCSGIIQVDNHRLYKTPTYYAQELYATLAGIRPLKVTPPIEGGLDLSATLSRSGDSVTLFAVNDSQKVASRELDLTVLGPMEVENPIWTLADQRNAGEPDVANSFAEPERVTTITSKILVKDNRLRYRFPALSLTVMRLRLR